MPHVILPRIGTDRAWREAARACLAARLAPERVTWSLGEAEDLLFDDDEVPPAPRPGTVRAPAAFVELAAQAVWHRDPERFARLYGLLWRLRLHPRLMDDPADAAVAQLIRMARAVRRDIHRLHAFVRFREVGDRTAPRRRFAAWIEPQHLTLEPAAPFFARRFADMDWLIATPDLVACFEDGVLRFEEGASRPELAEDEADALWRTYFAAIFNPARVNRRRMLAEMPRRWWAQMPEAAAIPDLLRKAEAAARTMAEAPPREPPLYARALARRAEAAPPRPHPPGPASVLAGDLAACRACPLWEGATQPVPGEGPPDAPLMLVGEQPEDRDDLTGRPFAGPAGDLLLRLLAEAGIDRAQVYLTHAVKHFNYMTKGRQRLARSPGGAEIAACRPWLLRELELVRPRLIVALGATAAAALTGRAEGILRRRGGIEAGPEGLPVLLTLHPGHLLRLPDPVAAEMETEALRRDLITARRHLEGMAAGSGGDADASPSAEANAPRRAGGSAAPRGSRGRVPDPRPPQPEPGRSSPASIPPSRQGHAPSVPPRGVCGG
ncbi:putative DNA metabolism protein [Rubellimicrobium thermophilum DSM 16684]|uniref:Type-4 uracil-DNA glycosylase n=1 Tax=Rubellimicrobium thermophilum DSM 16684 TaxID=1123069 RepID=S9SK20_9RHOB|nr:putative DNA metabolism protein [Rubellimicrobium thermophilum DSM 16684]